MRQWFKKYWNWINSLWSELYKINTIIIVGEICIFGVVLYYLSPLLYQLLQMINKKDLVDVTFRDLTWVFFGIVTIFGAITGLIFSTIRAFAVERQTATAEQELITSNMTKAIEQLGSDKNIKKDGKEITVPNIEVRLGGLYGLERIAKDSQPDHIQIMGILCAYIRNNALENENAPKEKIDNNALKKEKPREDVQAALTIIARRDQKRIQLEEKHKYYLNLEECYLVGAHLYRANLTGADLTRANLNRANLTKADLSGAHLYDANLTGSFLNLAKLNGTKLMEANLTGANLYRANLTRRTHFSHAVLYRAYPREANFTGANLTRAYLTEADLTGANLTGADLTEANLTAANLTRATLINLQQVNEIKLTNTILTYTILWNVNLSESKNLTQQQVDNIKHADATVILPEHLSPPSHWKQEKMSRKNFINEYAKKELKYFFP